MGFVELKSICDLAHGTDSLFNTQYHSTLTPTFSKQMSHIRVTTIFHYESKPISIHLKFKAKSLKCVPERNLVIWMKVKRNGKKEKILSFAQNKQFEQFQHMCECA
jgi:hypothetical protein